MKSAIVASALVFVTAGPACAQLGPPCKTFDRSSADAPQFVRGYLDDSTVLSVNVCGSGDLIGAGNLDLTFYFGAGDLVHDGNVCRYSQYELTLSPANPPRLERKAARPQTYMLVSESETCPSPRAIKYIATNDVPQNVFVHLVRVWRDAAASPASFDRAVSWAFGADDWRRRWRSRLRDVILQGRSDRLAVQSVLPYRDLLGLWKVYELHVTDPDHFDQFYVVTVLGWFGRAYAIMDVSAGIY